MTIERYRGVLSPSEFDQLQAALERSLPAALRLNTLKPQIHTYRQQWAAAYGWEMTPVPFCAAGWQVENITMRPSQTSAYKMGDFYLQDAASMLPVELFSPHPAPLVLDLAAAPGGKTTHLVSHFGDAGVVIANDSSRSRLEAVKVNLQTWGALNVAIANANGEQWGRWFPNTFDRILLDAPCSGETLRPEKGNKHRLVSESEQDRLQQRQIALLTSAFHAAKVGGEIVYSTCTLSPDENEAVLDALLHAYPEAVAVEALPNFAHAPALTTFEGHAYHAQVEGGIRLWNHLYGTSGFFAARLRKLAPTESPISPPPQKQAPRPDFKIAALVRSALENYGFDLTQLGDDHTIFVHQELVYFYGATLREQFAPFLFYATGFLLGHLTPDGFLPSHELIARFEDQFTAHRLTLTPEQLRQWWQGYDVRDSLLPSDTPPFIWLQDEQGRYVGRGKVSQGRIRNLLPKRLIG